MPRHFHKTMQSPHFQSEEYRNSSVGQCEIKIENFFKTILNKFKNLFHFL